MKKNNRDNKYVKLLGLLFIAGLNAPNSGKDDSAIDQDGQNRRSDMADSTQDGQRVSYSKELGELESQKCDLEDQKTKIKNDIQALEKTTDSELKPLGFSLQQLNDESQIEKILNSLNPADKEKFCKYNEERISLCKELDLVEEKLEELKSKKNLNSKASNNNPNGKKDFKPSNSTDDEKLPTSNNDENPNPADSIDGDKLHTSSNDGNPNSADSIDGDKLHTPSNDGNPNSADSIDGDKLHTPSNDGNPNPARNVEDNKNNSNNVNVNKKNEDKEFKEYNYFKNGAALALGAQYSLNDKTSFVTMAAIGINSQQISAIFVYSLNDQIGIGAGVFGVARSGDSFKAMNKKAAESNKEIKNEVSSTSTKSEDKKESSYGFGAGPSVQFYYLVHPKVRVILSAGHCWFKDGVRSTVVNVALCYNYSVNESLDLFGGLSGAYHMNHFKNSEEKKED